MMGSAETIGLRAANESLRRYVDLGVLPGASSAVLLEGELVDKFVCGWADKERGIELRDDHIFRVWSNTKLVTSIVALLLWQEGHFALDDPIADYMPQLANLRVLRAGAKDIRDTVRAQSQATIRQLLSHSAGFSYGVFDVGTPIHAAYVERGVLDPRTPLAEMIEQLATLPLAFQPGTGWEYSVATDVIARLTEVVTGHSFDEVIERYLLQPLQMNDTAFFTPSSKQSRLTAYYAGASVFDPVKPGLSRIDDVPYPRAFQSNVPRLSGGGGLVSTLPDMLCLLRALLPGPCSILRDETRSLLMTNQLAAGIRVRLPSVGTFESKAFTAAGAITLAPGPGELDSMTGEVQWGGIGGTHWWIAPRANLAGLVMTHRHMSFWHPFWFEFKHLVHRACVR
jgi:CubicO group peptidase (beta-lactamase class C family)